MNMILAAGIVTAILGFLKNPKFDDRSHQVIRHNSAIVVALSFFAFLTSHPQEVVSLIVAVVFSVNAYYWDKTFMKLPKWQARGTYLIGVAALVNTPYNGVFYLIPFLFYVCVLFSDTMWKKLPMGDVRMFAAMTSLTISTVSGVVLSFILIALILCGVSFAAITRGRKNPSVRLGMIAGPALVGAAAWNLVGVL